MLLSDLRRSVNPEVRSRPSAAATIGTGGTQLAWESLASMDVIQVSYRPVRDLFPATELS